MSQPSLTERLGIAGTGAVAAGLARLAAARGEVVVWARSAESEARARDEIGDEARITTHLRALASCSFVVESVVEDLEVKSALLHEIGALAREDTVIGSTTSSLSVAELAEASGRPEQFVGLHVFNPVERMDLVELAYPRRRFRIDARARPLAVRGARQDRRRGPRRPGLRRQPAAVPVPLLGGAPDGAPRRSR